MFEGDAAAADGKYLIVAWKISDYHAACRQGAERKGIEQELRDWEQHELQYREVVDLFEKDTLGNEKNLIDEKNKKEEKKRHKKWEEILSSYMAIH